MKTCSRCHIRKSESEFSPNRALKSRDGLSYQCKQCKREMAAEWRARNQDRRREYDAAYYQAHKERLNKRSAVRKRKD